MKTKPICEIRPDGTKAWYLNGKRHRKDGPAVEWANGDKAWYLNGKCHREDGPAIEYADGSKAWYLNDKRYTELDFYRELYKRNKITKEELFIKLI